MNFQKHTLGLLNWGFITTNLASHTRSPLGTALVQELKPMASHGEAELFRSKTKEALALLKRSSLHAFVADTTNPEDFFDRSSRDGVLEAQEIWACGQFMSSLGLVADELPIQKQTAPLLAAEFVAAPRTPPLCAVISKSVTSGGEILDSASSDLARLRRDRTLKRAGLEQTLTNKVKDWHKQGLLQDQFFDVREGRYVVPLRVESQSKLQGTLLGRSNTGQSVFVEPTELMIPNNALKEVELAIRAEEFRILKSLSGQVGALKSTYIPWIQPLAWLDACFASALLSQSWNLHAAKLGTQALKLLELFHPELSNPVKNSFELRTPLQSLLISGPNAGGKTVLLKATALAALMNSAGLFVATAENSEIPHYTQIITFIGDDQSIAQGLSSFSAQISEFKQLLESKVSGKMLIVVDEILSSTNPEEASALAQSLIEELINRGHHVLVSSHFSDLAVRLRSNPHVLLAAMEFESSSSTQLGRPTYRIRLGELGSSHALEMAERLGISASILKRARELVSTVKLDYDKALQSLKEKERQVEEEHHQALQQLKREHHQAKQALQKEFEEKTESFLKQAQEKLDEIVKKLTTKTSQKIVRIQNAAKSTASTSLEEIREFFKSDAPDKPASKTEPVAKIEVGSFVKIAGFSHQSAQVLEIKPGTIPVAVVQMGNFKMERAVSELTLDLKKEASRSKAHTVSYESSSTALKLDVRGKRFDEAISEIEAYLDHGFRSGAPFVTVITGHGTGALKSGLKELIKKLPYVKDAKPEHGNDDGALMIEFDR